MALTLGKGFSPAQPRFVISSVLFGGLYIVADAGLVILSGLAPVVFFLPVVP